ncbi:MAG: hypothetical protein U0S36_04885 [Candidatus Nanopelagicales bacterium]
MAIREHQLGEGTIKFRGEPMDYYLGKAGVWRRARWFIAGALAVVGLMFLVGSFAQVTTATATSMRTVDDQVAEVTLKTASGDLGTVRGLDSLLPRVGDSATVMVLPGGRVVLGDRTGEGRVLAIAFLLVALGMVLWAVRQDRVRGTGPRITGPVDYRIGDGDHAR